MVTNLETVQKSSIEGPLVCSSCITNTNYGRIARLRNRGEKRGDFVSDGRVIWSKQSSVGQIDMKRGGGNHCLIGSEDGC